MITPVNISTEILILFYVQIYPIKNLLKIDLKKILVLSDTHGYLDESIIKYVKKTDYDYVLIHGYQTLTCWLIMIAARLQGIKIILRGEALIRQKKFSFHKLSTKIPIK